jgi:hypothetical protein
VRHHPRLTYDTFQRAQRVAGNVVVFNKCEEQNALVG